MKLKTEQIERAKCVNLPSFLMVHGFELKKAGREYVLREHDSVNIKDNAPGEHGKWYRFSTDEGGDNIDFVREFMGKSFVEAVELLNGESYVRDYVPSYSYERQKEIKTAEVVINENHDVRRTVDYLCLARKLDLDIISKLISDGKIVQESGTDNVVFKVYDENNRLVGAEKVGTSTGQKFKGIAENSASGYGFEIVRGSGEKAMFFESAIDLLSYLQMYSPDNCRLVSMMGVNMHKALKYAVKIDLLNSNPSEKTELPKLIKYTATFYNEKELEQLFKAFEGDRMQLVVYIAAYYGLRRSEVCGLKWDAIDFDKKTITVCRKVVNEYGDGEERIICDETLKTEASKRTLPLIPKIERMLKERKMLEIHYSRLLKNGFDHTYDGFVCRDNYGKLITPNFISGHFNLMIKKHNLRHLRFHDLRHSCTSLPVANGVPMKAIQKWLGHSTFNVTANYYSHLDYNSKISSAETIARVLGGSDSDNNQIADI